MESANSKASAQEREAGHYVLSQNAIQYFSNVTTGLQLVESVPDALLIVDGSGIIQLVNTQAEKCFGYGRAQLIGQPIEVLIPDRFHERHREKRNRYLAAPRIIPMGTGSGFVGRRKDGSEFPAEISLGPLETAAGNLVVAICRDVTQQRQAALRTEMHLQTETIISSILHASLSPMSLPEFLGYALDQLLCIPWIALESKGSIYLVHSEGDLMMTAHRGLPPAALAKCRRVSFGKCLCGITALTRAALFVSDIDERHSIHYDGMQPHGHCCLPLLSGGVLVGVITLYVGQGHVWQDEQRTFLQSIADTIASAITRKQSEDALSSNKAKLLAAQRIQEHILPHCPPLIPGFDIAGSLYPAEFVAGDHFDYLPMKKGAVGIVVGDVSGHGFDSALLMASVHSYMRLLATIHDRIEDLLIHANALLSQEFEPGRYVTMFVAMLDPAKRLLSYVNAGHPAGYLLDRNGRLKSEMTSTAFPLGLFADAQIPSGIEVVLDAGDLVLLMTDGVLEAESSGGVPFGTERALEVVRTNHQRTAEEIVAALHDAVCHHIASTTFNDDLTSVVMKAIP